MICTASGSKSHLGKIAFIDEDYGYAFGGFMGMLTPSAELVPKYLFHLMTSGAYEDFIGALADGMNINNLKFDELKQFQVPYPPLPEQRRIVGILDEAFAGLAPAKANAEKNLHNARALFESHLQSVFSQRGHGWIEKPLNSVAEFSQGIQVGLGAQSNAPGKGLVRFIRITDYTQGTEDIRYVKDPGSRYWAGKSDIVMVRYGTPGLVGRGIEGVIANNLFKISILDGSLTNDFLAYFLGQQSVQSYLSTQGSSTMPALTFKQLGVVAVSFPCDLGKQNSIVAKLDALSIETTRLAAIYQQKLAALEALKKSLLHQAFSGEL
jgi:type I restriction enzyme S subunit